MIRKFFLFLLLGLFAAGAVQNVVVDPGAGLFSLAMLALLGYVGWRAWPSIHDDIARLSFRLFGARGRRDRRTRAEGVL